MKATILAMVLALCACGSGVRDMNEDEQRGYRGFLQMAYWACGGTGEKYKSIDVHISFYDAPDPYPGYYFSCDQPQLPESAWSDHQRFLMCGSSVREFQVPCYAPKSAWIVQ